MQITPGPVFAFSALTAESRPAPAEASALVVTTFGLVATHGGMSVEIHLSPVEMRGLATVMHDLSSVLGADEGAMREMLLQAVTVAPVNA